MRTLVYAAVPADQVVEGDLYANGGTVTESRPADAEDCKRPIVVGRLA